MEKRINFLGVLGVIVLCGAILACSKKKDSDGSSSGGGVVSYVGSWTGSTSQSKSVSFDVVPGGISSVFFSFSSTGVFCSVSGTAVVNYSTATPLAITSGNFDDATGNPRFYGTFTSANSASGGIYAFDSYCYATTNVTWTASKPAGSPAIKNQLAGIAAGSNAVTFHEGNKTITISRHSFKR